MHATYDTRRADWYEVMGIMPVAVYNGNPPGDPAVKDAQAPDIPQAGVLTHAHLAENDNHGGELDRGSPEPVYLPSAPAPNNTIGIQSFTYQADSVPPECAHDGARPVPHLPQPRRDSRASMRFHTITACKSPCTAKTGVAYPIANGPVTFDSGELGFNGNNGGLPFAPAADRDTWKTPQDLPSGTYTYFCRIHPFMRGAFRVEPQSRPKQTLKAKKKQRFAKAAVTEILNKAGTVKLRAKLKAPEAGGGFLARVTCPLPGARREAFQGLARRQGQDQDQAQVLAGRAQDDQGVRQARAVEGRCHRQGHRQFGKTSTAKARFRLIG